MEQGPHSASVTHNGTPRIELCSRTHGTRSFPNTRPLIGSRTTAGRNARSAIGIDGLKQKNERKVKKGKVTGYRGETKYALEREIKSEKASLWDPGDED